MPTTTGSSPAPEQTVPVKRAWRSTLVAFVSGAIVAILVYVLGDLILPRAWAGAVASAVLLVIILTYRPGWWRRGGIST